MGASASSPRRTVEQPLHRLELEAVFRLIDEDDSGSISVAEFVAALSKDDTDQVGEMTGRKERLVRRQRRRPDGAAAAAAGELVFEKRGKGAGFESANIQEAGEWECWPNSPVTVWHSPCW